MNKKKFFVSLIGLVTLCSCGSRTTTKTETITIDSNTNGTATIKIYKSESSTATNRYIPPSKVTTKFTYNDLSGTLSNQENTLPSVGDVNLLVIPVHIPGDDTYKTEEVRSDIEEVFFGQSSSKDSQLGFKSLKEFYYDSSFGKCKIKGKVTNWFDASKAGITGPGDVTTGNSGTIMTKIFREAVDWAVKNEGINLTDYDLNNDGSIDGVWLIYDHLDWSTCAEQKIKADPDYNPNNTSDNDLNSAFWNFTAWDWGTEASDVFNSEAPTTSGMSWASFDMMYTSYADKEIVTSNYLGNDAFEVTDLSDLSSIKLDSHTFIHETGHLMGLNDYYTSDGSSRSPLGKFSMMDQNIGDFDSYSKLVLGWVTPYVVYGSSEILIQTAVTNDHQVIVIPSTYADISNLVEEANNYNRVDSFTYEFNPFSEYLLIDLYSPEGNNFQDTYGDYIDGKEDYGGITSTGVRIYHVDSRISKVRVINYDGGQKLSYESYQWEGETLDSNEAILMPISNDRTESSTYSLPTSYDYFEQIRLIEASGKNTFDSGKNATNSTLFTESSREFSINEFGYQFFNARYTFNDGNELPFKIKVKTLKEISYEL